MIQTGRSLHTQAVAGSAWQYDAKQMSIGIET